MKHLHAWLWLWLAVPGIVWAQAEALPPAIPQIQQAQQLIEEGKPDAAYELLEPLEAELAGNVEYDYLLGVSAVNSGKPARAVFALERAQESSPQYRDTALWLAVAYYQSGDKERAKSGFEAVLAQSSDAQARAKAEHYLDVLQREMADDGNQVALKGKVEAGVGYDSNIANSSAGYLGTPQLAYTAAAPASNQAALASIFNWGVEGRMPVSGHYAFVSIDQEKRGYNGHSIMDSSTLIAKGGMDFTGEDSAYRVNLARREFRQQGTSFAATGVLNNYNITGLEGSARWRWSPSDYLGALAQLNELRFAVNNTSDAVQALLGVNYAHLFQASGSPMFQVGYARIDDAAVRTKSSYNPAFNGGVTQASRKSDYFTLYLQYALRDDVELFSTSYLNLRRDTWPFARDPVVTFGRDRTTFISFGANWRVAPSWTVRPQVALTSNSSNIPIYAYRKTEGSFTLRYEFN